MENDRVRSIQDLDLPRGPLYTRDEYRKSFDATAYLKDFYTQYDSDPAMQVVLQLLPNVAFRLPKGRRLLDVGSGPTVHVALCFRDRMDEIYLSDFAQESRDEIRRWLKKDSGHFDWSAVTKFIALIEGRQPDDWRSIEEQTRPKVKGVLACNVFAPSVVRMTNPNLDVVTTFFCLEAACANVKEYRRAVKNIVGLLKPGGYLVLGGLLDLTWYKTGGKCYKSVRLTEEDVFSALRDSSIEVDDNQHFKYFNHEGVVFVVGQKSTVIVSESENQSNE